MYYLVGPQLHLKFRAELQTQADNSFAKGEAKIKTNCEKPMWGENQDKNFKFNCEPTESKKDSRMELSLHGDQEIIDPP